MKKVVRENADYLLEMLKEIGEGVFMIVKGILMTIYKTILTFCAFWTALGYITFELTEKFIERLNEREFARHYGKGV